MVYIEQYGPYKELSETGQQVINTNTIDVDNIDDHFKNIINILKDGIETPEVQHMMITIHFEDDIELRLSLFDYVLNLMMWNLRVRIGQPIYSYYLFFPENISQNEIKKYIDNTFIDVFRTKVPLITLNQIIDSCIGLFRELIPFQMYLANTLNIEDTIDLMNQYKEFYDTIHFDTTGIPISDIKERGMDVARTQIKYIKNSNHCLRDSFRTGEAISDKQYKEVFVNIGSKPDGQGSVYPHPINASFINGGLTTPEDICIDSSNGRVALILSKINVGKSGAFARKLGIDNQDMFLNPDPNYVCDTRHFEEVEISSLTKLSMFDLRYFRYNPDGVDHKLEYKKCKNLVGKKIYVRSPMTCRSFATGHGICYKCYGDLAYVNRELSIGQLAADALSSRYTQILLSAKHLLESMVIKFKWTNAFYNIFQVTFNTIALKEKDFSYKGWKMVIEEEIKMEDDMDESMYNYYINELIVIDPEGTRYPINTESSDNIYITPDFMEFIYAKKNKNVDIDEEEGTITINMESLVDIQMLFIMEIKNNELSKTMDSIKKLINNKTEISKYDKDSLLNMFVDTNISGKITINSVHFEVLLASQIRDADDEVLYPDWGLKDPKYQILTLDDSIENSPSITVRLQADDIYKVLRNPKSSLITRPSKMDLFHMEQPQPYLNESLVSDDFKPEGDPEANIEEPIVFDDPKIQVGRDLGRRKIPKKYIGKTN